MKLRSRLTGTVLIGTLTMFGLAACGSDDSNDDSDTKNDTSSESTEDAGSDDSDESDGDKPSKDEVIAGFTESFNTSSGGQIPAELVDALTSCVIEDVYDDLTAEGAQSLAEGSPVADAGDQQLLATSTGTCTTEVVSGG